MQIRKATDQDEEEWNRYVLDHPDSLAYHQFAWKKAVTEAYRFKSCYLIAEEDEQICGVLPMIILKCPFCGCNYVSLPYCDVGGCLVDSAEIETLLIHKAKELGIEDGISGIEYRTGQHRTSVEDVTDGDQKVRMVLELPTSSEIYLSSLKSKLRSQIKKPLKDGLTAKLGGLELVSDFYQIFSENMRDLGSPVHSLKWIKAIVRNYANSAQIGLVFTPDGELAAGGIILMHRETVSIPWASSLRRYNSQNANVLLYWNFLSFAADHGYKIFDFGRSTIGEGTYRFKKQWGATPRPLLWSDLLADKEELIPFKPSKLRMISERIWMKMPLFWCNSLGPLIRRYISL
ncbi:FemAB-related protein, PEP-CTERM system-associated [Desulfuromusa kysingii]|uniref:FemAB-related protein, PEP-CTERM system-associated n=1 Tax=Desulfuromusa kysingii TaxID=37625 RepID=A0A1H4B989_9BACT|nr:FemAB family XrtA/PEP-CTERM system-associated protein [Desulfuromusa kysingii]SEA44733.1 FemAB-related protein, PEP-CTERM system-associated [Desulfuromusa kysingii]